MRTFRCLTPSTLLVAIFWLLASLPSRAQTPIADEKYRTPPKEIADIVLADWHKNITLNNLSPDGKRFLITRSDGLPTVDRQGRPCIYLGELAFDPVAHRSHPLYVRSSAGFDFYDHTTKRTIPVKLSDKARVSNPVWSPDGSQIDRKSVV